MLTATTSCACSAAQRLSVAVSGQPRWIVGGELKTVQTDGTHTRTVDVVWTGCDQFTATYSQQ